jgi:hypothetical protein
MEASNRYIGMKYFTFFLLLSSLAFAQAGEQPPPREVPPSTVAPATVNLNDSENARKARAVLDQTIESLGGQPYLDYENRMEEGRYYPLYHGRTESTGIPYRYYVEYPDKDRFEVLRLKDIHIIPGAIDIGGIKSNKTDLVLIHNGDKGYEITYKGTAAQDKIELQNYLRRRQHSIEWIFRKWIRDPSVALFYNGVKVVNGKEAESVTLLNSRDDSVDVYLDVNSHYPIKISYSWRDPKDRQKNVEEEAYDSYKLVQGIWTPHSITRYFNGETSQQRFIATASYNLKLPDSAFEASVTYNPLVPMKK